MEGPPKTYDRATKKLRSVQKKMNNEQWRGQDVIAAALRTAAAKAGLPADRMDDWTISVRPGTGRPLFFSYYWTISPRPGGRAAPALNSVLKLSFEHKLPDPTNHSAGGLNPKRQTLNPEP